MLTTAELFELDDLPEPVRALLEVRWPWQALARLDAFGAGLLDERRGRVHPTAVIEGPLFLEEGAEVGPYAYLQGPVYLGRGASVGHTAMLRGPVVLAEGARVMHASEVKRSILLPDARAPHFNYVGDSIIGRHVNLGAGVKLANTKTVAGEITVGDVPTGLRKFGSAVGDGVSIGCNAVLAPGTLVGKGSVIYHGATVRGVVPPGTIVKLRQQLESVPRMELAG